MSDALGGSYFRMVRKRFCRQTNAVLGLIIILILVVVAIGAPVIAGSKPIVMKQNGEISFPAFSSNSKYNLIDFSTLRENESESEDTWAIFPLIPHGPFDTDILSIREAPSREHWLGTDDVGRDVMSRMIWGSRISLSVGLVAVSIYIFIGTVLGALAGYFGGWVDDVLTRCIEVMICLPTLMFLIAAIAFLGPGLFNVMLVIGLISWPGVARLARAEFLRLRNMDYVTAVKALGCSHARAMFRHVLPNALAPILVSATFGVASAILLESSLSFLGFGVPEPNPSWGGLLANGRTYFSSWWLTVFPGGMIFITILSYNLVGEGLRNAVDARLKD